MPPHNLHHRWHAPPSPSRARPIDEDGAPSKETIVANDHHRSESLTINVVSLEEIDDWGALDGVEGNTTYRARPAYPHGLHRHWHASSKISGHDGGGNHHRSDYVIDHLDNIDEGSGSVGSRSSEREIVITSRQEKERPLEQFYDYRHRFYNEQYHHFDDDNQLASGRRHHGLDDYVDDSFGIESVCTPSFVMLSEEFVVDGSSRGEEGDVRSTTSSISSEQNSHYHPSPQDGSRSIDDSFYYSHRASSYYSRSPSNSSSYISTVSSVTLSRALNDELEWRRRSNDRGICVFARLGDFVEVLHDTPSPQTVIDDDLASNDVMELYYGGEEYFVDKDGQDDDSLLALVDFGRIFTVEEARPTAKQSSAEEAFTKEAVLATATEALTFSYDDEG